jgi:hypothetical protein
MPATVTTIWLLNPLESEDVPRRSGKEIGEVGRNEGLASGPTCGEYIAQEEPTNKGSTAATAELIRLGVGTKVEMDTPVSPLQVRVMVSPEVAAEREA